MTFRVYALVDPLSREIRYVGVTKQRVVQRLNAHLRDARRGGRSHRATWLRSIDCPPIYETLQTCEDKWIAGEAERWWIAYLKAIGCDLPNHSHGGFTWPEEAPRTNTARVGWSHTKESLQAQHEGMRRYWEERAQREGLVLRSEEARARGRAYQRAWQARKRDKVISGSTT